MLEVFDNDSVRRILCIRRGDFVPSVELRHRPYLSSIPALFVQGRLRWFGQAARRPDGELMKDLLLPTLPRTWRRRSEDVGNHDQGRPGTAFQTESLRPRTVEKGLGESLY